MGKDVGQLLDEAESRVFEIAEEGARGTQGFEQIQPMLAQVIERIDTLYHQDNPSDVTGVPTGFVDLDRKNRRPAAGRPDHRRRPALDGQDRARAQYRRARRASSDRPAGRRCSAWRWARRSSRCACSARSRRLDQHKLRTGRLTDEDWSRLTDGVGKLHDAPIYIDETAALNPLELRARARRMHRQYGKLGLVVVDYLQLMSASGASQGENRATEISEISRSLKALAKELRVPVVALSQLNRGLEQRPTSGR